MSIRAIPAKGVNAALIAKDAIAVIVHRDNPVNGLSSEQLRKIFNGSITNWSQVCGENRHIRVYMVKKGSATLTIFAKAVLGGTQYGKQVKVVTPDAKIVATVARDPGAIGQISFAFLTGDKVRPLAVDGQTATVENPDYPITRPLYLTTKGVPGGAAKAFIDWTLSDAGQRVVKQRFVGVN